MYYQHLGYTKPLFILAFDHRSSFISKMFAIEGRLPTDEDVKKIINMKQIIYEGFKKAVSQTIPKSEAAILVDEEFGDRILRNAIQEGYTTILTVEKSGQEEFDFEYGDAFAVHIEKYKPAFAKALVRYNPEGDVAKNKSQLIRLKMLSDYCHDNNYKFLVEALIIATSSHLLLLNQDEKRYDIEIRPHLTVQMMKEFQQAGVEPDVWKIEGMEQPNDYTLVVQQAKAGGRNDVGVVILGRGEDDAQVEKWVTIGAHAPGIIGFAIGRTIFWEPLVALKNGSISRESAVDNISKNYKRYYQIFTAQKQHA